jgi:hypothetical protein
VRNLSVRVTKIACWFGLVSAMILVAPSVSGASAAGELEKAKDKGRVAFVLVTEPGAGGVAEAERVIGDAVKRLGKAVMVRLDRRDAENASLVSKYRLSGPQIPLVLVFAPNGIVAGGALAAGMTTERLLGMVPTKQQAVLLLASRSGMEREDEALAACKKAMTMAGGKLGMVRVDMADESEQRFLRKLRIDAGSGKPVTVVLSNRGQVTGAFEGAADPAVLVQTSAKVGGGCAPGACKPGAAACAPPAKKLAASQP